jgi:hypothetical protein
MLSLCWVSTLACPQAGSGIDKNVEAITMLNESNCKTLFRLARVLGI